MKVKNFFKTENGRFNSPTVERIDVVIEKGFAESLFDDEEEGWSKKGYGPDAEYDEEDTI